MCEKFKKSDYEQAVRVFPFNGVRRGFSLILSEVE